MPLKIGDECTEFIILMSWLLSRGGLFFNAKSKETKMRNQNFLLSVLLSCSFLCSSMYCKEPTEPTKSQEPVKSTFSIINRISGSLVSKENIRVKKEAIARDYTFGKKIDFGFTGVVSVLGGVLAYKLIKYYLKKSKFSEPGKFKKLNLKALTKKIFLFEKKLFEFEEKFNKIKDPKMLSGGWFRVVGKTVFTSFVTSSCIAVGLKSFDTFYKKYHCFDTLKEFIEVKFGDLTVLDELLYNAQLFDHYKAESPDGLQIIADRFVISLRNVVATVECIIAAMEYKVDLFEDVMLSQEDVLISEYLFDSLKNYCTRVTSILDGTLDQKMLVISNGFKHDVERLIASFNGLENRVAWLS